MATKQQKIHRGWTIGLTVVSGAILFLLQGAWSNYQNKKTADEFFKTNVKKVFLIKWNIDIEKDIDIKTIQRTYQLRQDDSIKKYKHY
jgi:hypothetical protein